MEYTWLVSVEQKVDQTDPIIRAELFDEAHNVKASLPMVFDSVETAQQTVDVLQSAWSRFGSGAGTPEVSLETIERMLQQYLNGANARDNGLIALSFIRAVEGNPDDNDYESMLYFSEHINLCDLLTSFIIALLKASNLSVQGMMHLFGDVISQFANVTPDDAPAVISEEDAGVVRQDTALATAVVDLIRDLKNEYRELQEKNEQMRQEIQKMAEKNNPPSVPAPTWPPAGFNPYWQYWGGNGIQTPQPPSGPCSW